MLTASLDATDRPALLAHFLALGQEDRRLRFGFVARDTSIERYVRDIDFERDAVFGVRSVHGEGRQFDGIAHLALTRAQAEIGVSVLAHARGLGIGSALVSRAATHARERGIEALFMQCLSENSAMMRIARSLGMKVMTVGPDSEATLSLPHAIAPGAAQPLAADPLALCDAALCDVLSPRALPLRRRPQPAVERVAARGGSAPLVRDGAVQAGAVN